MVFLSKNDFYYDGLYFELFIFSDSLDTGNKARSRMVIKKGECLAPSGIHSEHLRPRPLQQLLRLF